MRGFLKVRNGFWSNHFKNHKAANFLLLNVFNFFSKMNFCLNAKRFEMASYLKRWINIHIAFL